MDEKTERITTWGAYLINPRLEHVPRPVGEAGTIRLIGDHKCSVYLRSIEGTGSQGYIPSDFGTAVFDAIGLAVFTTREDLVDLILRYSYFDFQVSQKSVLDFGPSLSTLMTSGISEPGDLPEGLGYLSNLGTSGMMIFCRQARLLKSIAIPPRQNFLVEWKTGGRLLPELRELETQRSDYLAVVAFLKGSIRKGVQ